MKTPPTGMSMMLKALGLDIPPDTVKNVVEAVIEVRDTMRRIEKKLDEVLSVRNNGSASSGSDASSGNGSSGSIVSSGDNSGKD